MTERRLCKAHKRLTKEPCRAWAVRGMEVCRLHGGKSLRGVAAPWYKTGKYSKELPTQLAAQYQEALRHPEIHALVDEIALGETRLRKLLERIEHNDLGQAWVALDATWKQFTAARSHGDTEGMRQALDDAEGLINRGQTDYLLWNQILDVVKTVADLRLKEHRRMLDLNLVITADRAMLLFGLIEKAVHKAVTIHADPTTARAILVAIQDELRTIDTRGVAQARFPGPRDSE